MSAFKSFFLLECKRLLEWRRLIALLLLLISGMYFVWLGIVEYQQTLDQKAKFLEIEKVKATKFVNYRQYGTYGYRMLFVPSPISILFTNSGILPDTTAYADSGERMKIHHTLKGKNIFDLVKKQSGFTDFSGLLLFFGTLLALIYGFDSFNKEGYLKFLVTLFNGRRVFIYTLLVRVLILLLILILYTGIALLFVKLHGIGIPVDMNLLYFVLGVFLLLVFFLLAGMVIGMIFIQSSQRTGLWILLACWFVLVYIIPTGLYILIASGADTIKPVYQLEMETLEIFSGFEKKALELHGRNSEEKEITENLKTMISGYWNNEFKQIQKMESGMREEMASHIDTYHWLSILTPTTSYRSATNELSSRGFCNLLAYYRYVQKMKHKFVEFYIDRVYFSNFSKIEPFTNDEENLYLAESGVPATYGYGLLAMLVYISLLVLIVNRRYKKIVYSEPVKEVPKLDDPATHLNRKEYKVMWYRGDDFKKRVYNLLSGHRSPMTANGFKGILKIENTDITELEDTKDFLYICLPSDLPSDLRGTHLIKMLIDIGIGKKSTKTVKQPLPSFMKKTLDQLEPIEKSALMVELVGIHPADLYVVDDILKDMPVSLHAKLKVKMKEIASKGGMVLHMISQLSGDMHKGTDYEAFKEARFWAKMVETLPYKNGDKP